MRNRRRPTFVICGCAVLAACGDPSGPPSPPPPPPKLSIIGQQVAATTDSSLTVTWSTNHAATTQLTCGSATFSDATPLTTHSATLAGFLPNQTVSCDLTSETSNPAVAAAGRQATAKLEAKTASVPLVVPPVELVFARLHLANSSSCQTQVATPECQADILTLSAQGTTKNLTNTPTAHEQMPIWSPDGQRIAFISDRDRLEWDLYLMNADGSSVEQLPNTRTASRPQWSPSGAHLLYTRAYMGNPGPLCIIQLADRTQVCPVQSAWAPAWSHGGAAIAYIAGGKLCVLSVVTLASQCGPRAGAFGMGPAWSPDDGWIAFTGGSTAVADQEKLYVARPDGTELRRLTTLIDFGGEYNPLWSPDGGTIIIYRQAEVGLAGKLYRVQVQSGALNPLGESAWLSVSREHAFSRDGSKIILSGYGRFGTPAGGLWLVGADGSRLGRLTENIGWDEFGGWRPQ